MVQTQPTAEFVQHLTGCQHWLRAYLRSLLRDNEVADEVLQRTNLVLWQKSSTFQPGTNFRAWACQVARYEVLAFRKERVRDRHLFSEATIHALADDAERHYGVLEDLREFLTACLEQLPHPQRELVAARYVSGGSVQRIAAAQGASADAVSAALYRVRRLLLKCIQGKLAAENAR